ncbi:MAG: hypothetical protein OEW56_00680, partial [Gemmatimonadota bacterium]|nr:hypothetical protein [Gemmatimonadota bacterium]
VVFGPTSFSSDVDVLTLELGGTYTLLLEGYVYANIPVSYAFNIQPVSDEAASLVVGAPVSGSIAHAGQVDRYSFTLGEAAQLYFDSLTPNSSLYWSLTGPRGEEVYNRSFAYSDSNVLSGNPILDLLAGDYTLTVDGLQDATGAYAFRLLDVQAEAVGLTPGTVVSGTLDPGNQTDAYQFAALAGDRFYFDSQSVSGPYTPYWRLLDPYGGVVFGPTSFSSDVDVLTLELGGTYTLLLEGYVYANIPVSYAFNVDPRGHTDPLPLTGTEIAIGATVNGTIASAGQQDDYLFTLTAPARLYFDSFTASTSLYWSLTGPRGSEVEDRPFASSDSAGFAGNPIGNLDVPGTYQIQVYGTGTGAYSFRGLDMAEALGITPGVVVAGTLDPGNETHAYVFSAAAGDRFYFDAQEVSGSAYWRLLDPYGGVVFGPTPSAWDIDVLTLEASGSYTLLLEGWVYSTTPESYQFNLFAVPVSQPVPITGLGTEPAPDLVVAQLAVSTTGVLQSGAEVTISWSDINNGNLAGASPWEDRLLVRNEDSGEIIANVTVPYDGAPLGAGESVPRQFSLTLPDGLRGAGQITFAVTADIGNAVEENNPDGSAEANNTASLTVASAFAPYADLQIQGLAVTPPVGWRSGDTVTVQWTTANGGNLPTPTSWSDQVFLRNMNTGEVLLVAAVPYAGPALGPGEAVAREHAITWPSGLSSTGRFEFVVSADSADQIFEANLQGTAETNNASRLEVVSAADLAPGNLSAPASGFGGSAIEVGWTVTNLGQAATAVDQWVDFVILSPDDVLGNADDQVIGQFMHAGELDQGGSYAELRQVELPPGLDGDFHIGVLADGLNEVFEPETRANNYTAPAAISLSSPSADLAVEVVTVPATAMSGTPIDVSWRVRNLGDAVTGAATWIDRIFLSADATFDAADALLQEVTREGVLQPGEHYTLVRPVTLPEGVDGNFHVLVVSDALGEVYEKGSTQNNVGVSLAQIAIARAPAPDLQVAGIVIPGGTVPGQAQDITWTVSNEGTGTARAPWNDRLYLTSDDPGIPEILLGEVQHDTDLPAGESYTATARVTTPDVGDGTYRVTVRTDADAQVFEEGLEGNNVAASADLLAVTHPDLQPSAPVTPGTVISGTSATIRWTVSNVGTGPALGAWTDFLFLSLDDVVDASDITLLELSHAGGLSPGGSYALEANAEIPLDASGSYRILALTDRDNAVRELSGEGNNLAAASLAAELAPYADLAVSGVTAPALTIGDPAQVAVSWTVSNQGTGEGRTTSWSDAVYASRDAVLGNGDDALLASFVHDGALAAGESYSRSETFLLLPAFEGRYTLFVQTDAGRVVFENGSEGNNAARAPGDFDVMTIPYADLVVEAVTPDTPAYSGQELAITWVVRNQGIGLTNAIEWRDVVYLATNPDGSDRTAVAIFDHIGFLAPDGSYTRTGRIALPDGIEGSYYAIVETGGPFEFVYTDNNGRVSGPIEVRLTTPPDLVVSDIVAPESAPEGSAIDVTWTVRNQGAGDALGAWVDRVFLRRFGETGAGTPIGTFVYQGPLQAGMSYTRHEQIKLPSHVSDQFEILVLTDAERSVYEHTHEDNNQSVDDARITVTVLPRPDLQVASITGPAVVDAGGTASIEFTVINQGSVATRVPNWTDRVYLSLDDKITADDIVVSALSNGAALAPSEQYLSLSDTFEIPKRFRGTVYVIVMADQGGAVDEWPNETNNIRRHEIYVNPWPFADLVVSDVTAPAQAFEGNEIEVRYTVTNLGSGATDRGAWREQIWLTQDKNRPHPGLGDVLLGSLEYAAGVLERDAGYDRTVTVTLPDSVVSGTYYVMPWVDPYGLLLEDTLAVNVNPDDPNEVDNNNYKARAIDLIGVPVERRSDPAVESVSAEAFEYAGEEFTFAWTVANLGPGVAEGGWFDEVYLSDQPVFDPADINNFLLGRFEPVKALASGETYTNEQTLRLTPTAKGQYVHVNLLTDFMRPADRDLGNNLGTTSTDVSDRIPDLVVSGIALPATAYSGEQATIRYTVTNASDQPIWPYTQYWTDRIYLSKDPTFIPDPKRVTLLADVTQANDGPLAGGASYTQEVQVTLPPGIGGDYYVYVFCNVTGNGIPGTLPWPVAGGQGTVDLDNPYGYPYKSYAYEYSLNNMGQGELPVVYREPDLRVTELAVPDTVAAGETVPVTFTVTNVGTRDTREDQWVDRVYLSRDPSLDERDILMLDESAPPESVRAEYARLGVLPVGESYTATVSVTMPFDISGPFYVLAYTDSDVGPSWASPISDISPRFPGLSPSDTEDHSARVREFQGEGNNLTAHAVEVTPFNAPDLQVTALAAPERAVRGQSFDLTYTVTNLGGPTPFQQPAWDDLIYLSRDTFLDLRADRFLASVSHSDGLDAGGAYAVTRTLTVPTDLATEAYYVFVVTDPARYTATGDLFEGANERNNDRASVVPMIVELPPPTDLVVTDILVPAQARVGEPVHLEWTVANQSADVPAAGTWTDALYLSTDSTWEISDRPLGRVAFSGTVAPGDSYTLTLDATLAPAAPGQYRVIVRTDIFNQIYEDVNEANNRMASADTLSVAVDELQIGAPLATHLDPTQQRLYRLTVPADQTLRITLRNADPNSANEIFVRHDAVPTSASFDATYEGPLGSDLSVLVPSTEPGAYYLLVRNFSAPPGGTDITLLAELLPLAITDVRTDAGGDSRHVTTTIRGAQFHPDAIVKLVRPGIAEYEPLDWKVVDSSTIIAAFDFTDAPHGLYDLKVINPTGDEAIVPYRFLVERAIEPEVTIGIGGPRVILAGDQATYSVALQNLANLDAPYTYFEVGVPQLNLNPYVYGLPYLEFFTNVRGTPEGAAGSANAQVPWVELESITNTTGQLIASGYLFDEPADGFAGFSFNVITYPGLQALHDRAFEEFRAQMARYFPALDEHLEGGEGGLDAWWQAVKDEAGAIDPSYAPILDQIDFVGMYRDNLSAPGKCQIPFIPFRFHVVASATTMTREEFVAHQTAQAVDLRQAILQSPSAPGPLLALAADERTWVDLYLAALEDAGLLRPEGSTPPIRTQQHIVSLMGTIASGILFGPAGTSIRSDADLLGFFDQVRQLYGNDQNQMAEIEEWDPRESECYSGAIPIPALPDFADYDQGIATPTHFETFRIYVPWVRFEDRGAGLPEDFQISGPATPV